MSSNLLKKLCNLSLPIALINIKTSSAGGVLKNLQTAQPLQDALTNTSPE